MTKQHATASAVPAVPHTETFLPYMRDVARCEQSLQELNLMWRIIEASAKMNCPSEAKSILPTMAATRSGVGGMTGRPSVKPRSKKSSIAETSSSYAYVFDSAEDSSASVTAR